MRAELLQLERGHWPELYRLMVARRFPSVPERFSEAAPYFETVKIFGLVEGSVLSAGFVFGPPEDGIAYFDVVCSRQAEGMWASREVLRSLYRIAFEQMGLRCLWVQARSRRALKAALQAGFTPATPLDAEAPVLVMTPLSRPSWLKYRQQEEQ